MQFLRHASLSLLVIQFLVLSPAYAEHGFSVTNPRSCTSIFPYLQHARDGFIGWFAGLLSPSIKSVGGPASSHVKTYHGHIVVRFNVTTAEEETAFRAAAHRFFLDIWEATPEFVDVSIEARKLPFLLKELPESLRNEAARSILVPDLAAAVRENMPRFYPDTPKAWGRNDAANNKEILSPRNDDFFFNDYQPLQAVYAWMQLLDSMYSHVQMIQIGTSYESKPILALRVGHSKGTERSKRRKTIVVTGGLHAREWISTTTVNYLAYSFVQSYGVDRVITKLLHKYDFVFIPALNPDGIEYTWQTDRLWRKNRQPTASFCRGVDLDHAFGFEWDGQRHDTNPCSESYGGKEPWEAREAVELRNWAMKEALHGAKFAGMIDLHSYSQQILFPYAYSCNVDPPNWETLEELGAGLAKAIRLSSGELYSYAPACEGAIARELTDNVTWKRIDSGGGSALDWFYSEMKAHGSYQIKLRDTGSYGFLLPKDHIVPVGDEIFGAMKYYGDFLLGNNGIERLETGARGPAPEPSNEEVKEDAGWAELRRRRKR